MSVLSQPQFHCEEAAFAWLEATLWTQGPVCPHCRGMGRIGKIKANPEKRIRLGLHKCGDCKKQFTVRVSTVFEHARIPLHKMLQALHLMCSSKKGVSAHQLRRILEVQYRSAWFLAHRIREAMRDGALASFGGIDGMPGASWAVELDGTLISGEPGREKTKRGWPQEMKVLALVDRYSGQARAVVVDDLMQTTLRPIIKANIVNVASLFTDEARHYLPIGRAFADYQSMAHGADEYVRGIVHTNTLEGYFSVFKRGIKAFYQHSDKQYLHYDLAEFDFCYSNSVKLGISNSERSVRAAADIQGNQLMDRASFSRAGLGG